MTTEIGTGAETFPIIERPWHEDAPIVKPARKPRAPKKEVRTVWLGCLQTFHDGPDRDGKGVVATLRGETIGELIKDIYKTATYYNGQGYAVRAEDLERVCATCHGTGVISRERPRNVYKAKRCPECKGHAKFETMPPIVLEPHGNIRIINRP